MPARTTRSHREDTMPDTEKPYRLTGKTRTPDHPALLLRIEQDGRNSMSGCMEPTDIPGLLRDIAVNIEQQLGTAAAAAPTDPQDPFTFTDANGDTLTIARTTSGVSGIPSVAICTECGYPVHVPNADVPAVIVALGKAAGITPAPAAPADMTVYELRAGGADDPTPDLIATYADINAAATHGKHQYRDRHGTAADLEWKRTDTTPVWRLVAVDDQDGEETVTDWHIVQVTIPATYAPADGTQ